MDIHLVVEPDEDFEGYITFATWWNQNRTWRERFRVVWTILRGKSHYFDAILLDEHDTIRVYEYLGAHLDKTTNH